MTYFWRLVTWSKDWEFILTAFAEKLIALFLSTDDFQNPRDISIIIGAQSWLIAHCAVLPNRSLTVTEGATLKGYMTCGLRRFILTSNIDAHDWLHFSPLILRMTFMFVLFILVSKIWRLENILRRFSQKSKSLGRTKNASQGRMTFSIVCNRKTVIDELVDSKLRETTWVIWGLPTGKADNSLLSLITFRFPTWKGPWIALNLTYYKINVYQSYNPRFFIVVVLGHVVLVGDTPELKLKWNRSWTV